MFPPVIVFFILQALPFTLIITLKLLINLYAKLVSDYVYITMNCLPYGQKISACFLRRI